MYKEADTFAAIFRAAHPHLQERDRIALVELVTLWAGEGITRREPEEVPQKILPSTAQPRSAQGR